MYLTAHTINKKIPFIGGAIFFIMFIIVARLFMLQISLGDKFLQQSKKNFLRTESIESLRGNILDCNGTLLATNRPTNNIYWYGSGNYRLDDHQKKALTIVETITSVPLFENQKLLKTIKQAERYHKKILLAQDIPFEQLGQLEEQLPNDPNISIKNDVKRFYPYGNCASHLLGYLGYLDLEIIGKMGLEELFEHHLKGQKGTLLKTINSMGRNLHEQEIQQSQHGQHIQTTIDINLQQIAENVFPQEYSGTFILLDPETGALNVLVSRPNFDPTLFLDPISHEHWQELQEQKPFLNRAFNACYPPGSIFKLITTSAALEQNLIAQDSSWFCKGYVTFGKRKYWCNRRYGHKRLTTSEALEKSCNIMFYEIGKRISVDTLADYAYRFGLGSKTNILFYEKTGLVPSTHWKMATKGERWWPGETLSASIGQSFFLVTPIQVARMIASIFSGYLVTPRILVDDDIHQKPLNISENTREFLKESMKKVVSQGTGKRLSKVKDMEIYAKTSTAQTSGMSKRHLGKQYKEHGWFVSYFQYKDYKPMTMVILVEHAGSSRVPTDIAKNFLLEYKKLAGLNKI